MISESVKVIGPECIHYDIDGVDVAEITLFLLKYFKLFKKNTQIVVISLMHIWHRHENCIEISTNRPSISAVVLKVAPSILRDAKSKCMVANMQSANDDLDMTNVGIVY